MQEIKWDLGILFLPLIKFNDLTIQSHTDRLPYDSRGSSRSPYRVDRGMNGAGLTKPGKHWVSGNGIAATNRGNAVSSEKYIWLERCR